MSSGASGHLSSASLMPSRSLSLSGQPSSSWNWSKSSGESGQASSEFTIPSPSRSSFAELARERSANSSIYTPKISTLASVGRGDESLSKTCRYPTIGPIPRRPRLNSKSQPSPASTPLRTKSPVRTRPPAAETQSPAADAVDLPSYEPANGRARPPTNRVLPQLQSEG